MDVNDEVDKQSLTISKLIRKIIEDHVKPQSQDLMLQKRLVLKKKREGLVKQFNETRIKRTYNIYVKLGGAELKSPADFPQCDQIIKKMYVEADKRGTLGNGNVADFETLISKIKEIVKIES